MKHGNTAKLFIAMFIALTIALTQWYQAFTFSLSPFESPIWPASGISLGLCYLFGIRQIWVVLVTLLASNVVFFSPENRPEFILNAVLSASICAQSAAIYLGFKQSSQVSMPFATSSALRVFLTLSAIAVALSSVLLLIASHVMQASPLPLLSRYTSLLLANASGILIFAPILLVLAFRNDVVARPVHALEYFAWGTTAITLGFISHSYFQTNLILLTPILMWAAARFNTLICAVAVSLVSLAIMPAFSTTTVAFGDTVALISTTSGLAIWILLGITSLYFNVMLSDRIKAELELEATIAQRTADLNIANQELKDEIFVREQAERSLMNTSKRYRLLIETAGIPIIVLDHHNCIRQWNIAAESAFGYSRDHILTKNFIDHFIPETEQDEIAWKLKRMLESGIQQDDLECTVKSHSTEPLTMLWNINVLPSLNDELDQGQFLFIGQNISNIRKTQDQLHYLAHFDALTGCANRRLFEDRCEQAIVSASRHRHHIALIGLDIDHFKRINDTLGHDAGDEYLVTLVSRLKQCVRREDTIARLGGDEFAILLANVNGQEGAEVVARNILEAITQPVSLKGNELVISSSIGITMCPTDGTHYPDLLKNADLAMYRAKNAGRNNIQFYSPEMNNEMQRQLQIEQELRTALQDQQFQVYYQPIIDIETGEVVALEALLRWNHPDKGVLRPGYFLQIAEQSGLLLEIGRWAFEMMCQECLELQQLNHTPMQIALNLSNRQYNHPGLIAMIQEVTEQTGFTPRNLILEMSESTITTNDERSVNTLNALHNMGISLTIDSFGTGLSSLRQLKQIPIDIIKIDRSFVNGIPEDKNDMTITETLLTVANQMDIKTFATGVETKEQEAFLKINGCRYAQGYLYSAPLPYKKITRLFRAIQAGEALQGGDQIFLPFETSSKVI